MASDEELVGRLARGEETALAELLRRYERPLSSFLYRHTAGRDVEDLYQETWLRVVRNSSSFEVEKRFSSWLFQIALNLARDWHRRRPPDPSEIEPPSADSGEFIRAEAAIDAARLLAMLPE